MYRISFPFSLLALHYPTPPPPLRSSSITHAYVDARTLSRLLRLPFFAFSSLQLAAASLARLYIPLFPHTRTHTHIHTHMHARIYTHTRALLHSLARSRTHSRNRTTRSCNQLRVSAVHLFFFLFPQHRANTTTHSPCPAISRSSRSIRE